MESEQLARRHSLKRTSPKGPGQKFVGVCVLCGKTGLTFADMQREDCPNLRALTEGGALIEAVTGEAHD